MNAVLKRLYAITDKSFLDQPSKHYNNNHNHTPPWILFKNASWSDCSDLYGFLKTEDKNFIANELLPDVIDKKYKKELLSNSLYIIRKFRNKIAHPGKFITFTIDKRKQLKLYQIKYPFKKSIIRTSDFKKPNKGRDIFAMILSICLFLHENNVIFHFISDIENVVDSLSAMDNKDELWQMYCKITGIPCNLIQRFRDIYHTVG